MNKEVISDRQGIILMILFVWGSSILVGAGGAAKKDLWLALIIALIMALILVGIYIKLLNLYFGRNLYEIVNLIYGKYIGTVISIIYIWYSLHLGALVIDNFGQFISTVGLPETPIIVPKIFLTVLCAWAAKEGIEVIARWGQLFIVFIFFIMVITLLFAIPSMKPWQILPVMEDGVMPLVKGSFGTLAFPFLETVIIMAVTPFAKTKESISRIFRYGTLIGGIFLLMFALRNLFTIGANKISFHYFPSYIAVGRINIGDFIQRPQILLTTSFLITGFVKISLCLLAMVNGIAKLLKLKDFRTIVYPSALLMLSLSTVVYKNIIETVLWSPTIYPVYAMLFQLIIPAATLIIALVKSKNSARSR
jgi:spore germination protein KB